ncbi:MAG: hypothetical protein R3C25_09525 [Hyphomonadaceae bacterium]
MSVALRHSPALELNLVEYRDAIALEELRALAEYLARNPSYLRQDTLNLIHPGAHFESVTPADLDALFDYYRVLFAPLQFDMIRRAAWVCLSSHVEPLVAYWIDGRNMKKEMSSAVRSFTSMSDAGDWLVISEAALDKARRGEGFTEIVAFDSKQAAAPLAR